MFCISVVIVMLSVDLAWMYALIKKSTTNHNMWPIFSANISLRLQSYFRLFLLHGHLKVMRTINIWTRYIGGYIQECTALCVKVQDSLCTFSISRGHFLKDIWNNIIDNPLYDSGEWWCNMGFFKSFPSFNEYQGILRNVHFKRLWSIMYFNYHSSWKEVYGQTLLHYLRHWTLSTRQLSTPGHD